MSKPKGFTKCDNRLLFSNDLSPISKLVLVGLSYFDRSRGCWASKQTLRKMLNVSLYQLRKALNELEEQGFILIHRRYNGHTDLIRVVKETATPKGENTATPHTIIEKEIKEEELGTQTAKDADNTTEDAGTPKNPPQNTPQSPNAIKPLPIHQETTERLHERLRDTIRPQSYSYWFENKTCVSFDDNTSMAIRCVDNTTAKWLEGHYTALIESIVGKQVAFHAKE